MSNGSDEAIRRVIAAFERSTWSEIDVRVGSLRVHLRADDDAATGLRPPASRPAESHARNDQTPATPSPSSASANDASRASQIADLGLDVVIVRSPSPGIFWRSPEPGAPPFADVGQRVDPTSTLCIVEVMKLMNHIKAGVTGTVVAVFGRDGVALDKAEPMFAIDPSNSTT
jgi:acetyl-CoA carboxylase biotin carboxyl carrier protein